MRIAIDARMDRAGIGRYTRSLVTALTEIDSETEYVLCLRRRAFEEFRPPAANVVPLLADIEWYSLDEQTRLPALLRRGRYDLVHFPHFNVPLLAPRPFVVTVHDLTHMAHSTARPSPLGRLAFRVKRVPYRVVVRTAMRRASHVLTVSEYTRSVVVDRLGVASSKMSVTYEAAGAIPAPPDSQEADPETPYFLYVGNAFPYKNLARLIEAFARFQETHGSSHVLALAGEQSEFAADLAAVASRAGVGASVRFLGPVSDGDLARLYAGATALAFVSMSEGFGLPGLEAMQYGTPVVAASGTALPEIYGDAALYVDPYDVEDIASGLARIADDSELGVVLAARGRERTASFSWQQTAERTLDVYRRVLVRDAEWIGAQVTEGPVKTRS